MRCARAVSFAKHPAVRCHVCPSYALGSSVGPHAQGLPHLRLCNSTPVVRVAVSGTSACAKVHQLATSKMLQFVPNSASNVAGM